MADSAYRINRGVTLNPQSAVPTNPTNGDIYYDDTLSTFVFYNNGSWINMTSKADVATATNLTSAQFTATVVQNSLIRLTGSTVTNLHGMLASSSAKLLVIYNQSSIAVTIVNQSGTEGTAANRILVVSGVNAILNAGQTATFVYDSGQSRWILTSIGGSGKSFTNEFAIVDASDPTKQIAFDTVSATTNTKTTITGSQTANRNITLPDATDTLVGKATTDNLTNKSLSDSTTAIVDASDPTKQITFDAAGTTGTKTTITGSQTANRVQTLQDTTDTFVYKNTVDALTNKQVSYSVSSDATTTGANATAQAFTTGVIRLTNASLTSLSGIPAGNAGQFLIVENKTGAQITVNNEEAGASAADRILTGSNSNVSMPDNATFIFTYDATSSRWMLSGGSGSGSGSGGINLIEGGNAEAGVTGWSTYGLTEAVTFQDTGDTVTLNSHGAYETVAFTGITSTTGISTNTLYYVVNATTNTFQLSLTRGGAAIALTTNGSGTMVRGRPRTGTGGSGSAITWSTTTTNPLNDIASFTYAKNASMAMGQGVSKDFSVPLEFRGKALTTSAPYIVNSGTFNAGTKTVDSDAIVYFYDITNSKLVEPSSFKFLSNSTTSSDSVTATVQFDYNCTSARMIIHTATVNSSAFTLKLDDISVGPANYQYGTPVTDWQAFTPTGSWVANSPVYVGYWRRVGDSMEIKGKVTCGGAPTATALSINLPSGYTIDTSSGTTQDIFGQAYMEDAGVQSFVGVTTFASTTAIAVQVLGAAAAYTNPSSVTATVPFTFGNTDFVNFNAKVKILGWSSSVQTSDQTDTRVVSFQAHVNASTRSAANNTDTIFPFNTVDTDTHGTFNTTSNAYVVPVPGSYIFYSFIETGSLFGAASDVSFNLYVNGVQRGLLARNSAAVIGGFANSSIKVDGLKTGDSITVVCNQNSGGSVTIGSASNRGNFIFGGSRISGPSAIAATETIACRYSTAAGQSIANGATTTVIYGTRDFDTHGAMNSATGVFTAPISGTYEITSCFLWDNATNTLAASRNIILYRNGSNFCLLSQFVPNATYTGFLSHTGTSLIRLNAGDTLDVRANHNESTARSLRALADGNYVCIKRIK